MKPFFDQILYDYAMRLAAIQYRWGGDDPIDGFDCSGYVIELLKSCGELPHDYDDTAQGLFSHLEKGRAAYSPVGSCAFGAIVFWGASTTKIVHVGFGLDLYRVMQAGGGDRTTRTSEDAARMNAFIRPRPLNERGVPAAILKPYYRTIGRIA